MSSGDSVCMRIGSRPVLMLLSDEQKRGSKRPKIKQANYGETKVSLRQVGSISGTTE